MSLIGAVGWAIFGLLQSAAVWSAMGWADGLSVGSAFALVVVFLLALSSSAAREERAEGGRPE